MDPRIEVALRTIRDQATSLDRRLSRIVECTERQSDVGTVMSEALTGGVEAGRILVELDRIQAALASPGGQGVKEGT